MSNEHFPGHDARYSMLDKNLIPKSECLKDTVARVLPYWFDNVVPAIKVGDFHITEHLASVKSIIRARYILLTVIFVFCFLIER